MGIGTNSPGAGPISFARHVPSARMAPMRPRVVVAEPIAPAGIEALAVHCEVVDCVGSDRDALTEWLADAQALIVRSATQVDSDMIGSAPHLKVIGRAGIGVDNIDVEAATAAGVVVVNAPQANIISAAEHTVALLLAQARNLPRADAVLRSGVWDRKSFQGVELHGRTLGVVGLGRIGSLVARRAQAFGMRVIAHDPYVGVDRARRLEVEMTDSLDQLYAEADFITLHLPLTAETLGMINAATIAKMRPGVRIVNASRGGIINEAELADAVRSGRVAGAALDVFATEPTTESPLFELPQVVVTPHLGASTREAQDKAGVDVAEAVAAALRGELVLSAVNVDLGTDVTDEVRRFLPLAEHLGRVFVGMARGLPDRLTVRIEGRLAEYPVRPLRLAALKGALSASQLRAGLLRERSGLGRATRDRHQHHRGILNRSQRVRIAGQTEWNRRRTGGFAGRDHRSQSADAGRIARIRSRSTPHPVPARHSQRRCSGPHWTGGHLPG